ncbi:MAG: DUF1015 domain-containing protein [Phycisphaerales bacterium]|nr:DUF1015 domain-containing protein [Phycisphaerales bacterium]
MANVQPMAAVRYPQSLQTDLISPPYDVLSAADKAAYLKKNAHNIVAVDLPHVPPKTAGPAAAYAAAATTLESWLQSGVLKRDGKPTLYPYQQTYAHAGVTYQRRGLFCRVGLEEFGPSGTIHPHEQTFSGPKEDRLLLMRSTHANLSPVFGLYDDATNAVTNRLFEHVAGGPPIATASLPTQDGKGQVLSELWMVTDAKVIADVQNLLADKHLYIADGHHRYSTCLTYRKELAQSHGGHLPKEHPANFGLFVLVAMQDPGLIVLPTHRVVSNLQGFSADGFVAKAAGLLKVLPGQFTGGQLDELEKRLAGFGPHAMGVYDPAGDRAVVVVPSDSDPLGRLSDDAALAGKSKEWRQLDVAILQHLIFDRIVKPHFAGGQDFHWAFPHEAHEVVDLCRSGQYQAGFVLQPTPLEAVRQLCNAHELMPQKSTFFYPKLATGMVINTLVS